MNVVSISDAQRQPLPWIGWCGTVYHGIAEDLYHLHETPGEYLAFLGRICPEKRVDRAIEIAKRSGRKLKIAAKVDTADREYFSDYIKPLLNHPLIELIGENGNLPTLNFNPCSFGQTDAGNLRLAVGTAWENAHPPWFMGNWRRPERGISRKRPRAIVPHRLA